MSVAPCQFCGNLLQSEQPFCGRCGKPTGLSPAPDPDLEAGEVAPPTTRRSNFQTALLEGKWRLESKLGEGGMGSVYLAHDLTLDRKVAIKLLGKQFINDAEIVARFEREGRLTASLEHPNIVPIYAVGRVEERPFLVMKVLEGQTLLSLIRTREHLGLDETLALLRQLSAGLGFIHARGYVHRDIKSTNIYVGSEGHATILDFGILRPERNHPDSLTRPGVVIGTPQYMSPEQALGAVDVDLRADLYALAVVLFECVTGHLPFEGDSELSVIQMHAHAPIPDAAAGRAWVTPEVAAVIKRGLAKRPDERFQKASEFLEAFENAVLGEAPRVALPRRMTPSSGTPSTQLSVRKRAEVLMEPARARSGDTGELLNALRPSPGRRMAVVFTLLVLLLGGGLLALVRLRGPTVTVLAAAVGDAGTAEVATAVDAGGALTLEEPVDAGSADEASPAPTPPPPTPEDSRPSRKTKLPRKRTGTLTILSFNQRQSFWAAVSVNGAPRGNTPLSLQLPVGRHRIRVERTGFQPWERQVRVLPGQPQTLRIDLRP